MEKIYINRKKIICAVLLVIVAVMSSNYISYLIKASREQSGMQWFQKQSGYLDTLNGYADSMDDVFALYLSGSINEEDFIVHLDGLQEELKIIYAAYCAEVRTHPVTIGSHTYMTKKGAESVENCYLLFQELIDMSYQNYMAKDVLTYKYLAFHQKFIDSLSEYMTAKSFIERGETGPVYDSGKDGLDFLEGTENYD